MAPSVAPAEPAVLICPITHVMFRDPVFVPESGNTYERSALEIFWNSCKVPKDPLTNLELGSEMVYTNWGLRREVQSFLDQHPVYLPQGWEARALPSATEPRKSERKASWRRPVLLAASILCSVVIVMEHVRAESFWHLSLPTEEVSFENSERLKVPKGSKLEAWKVSGRLVVKIPASGFQAESCGQLVMSSLWLGFVGYWTATAVAARVPLTFVAFSFPFWAVGLLLFVSTLLTPSLSQMLVAGPEEYQVSNQLLQRNIWSVSAHVSDLQEKPGLLCMSEGDCKLVLQDGVHEVIFGAELKPTEVRWIQRQLCSHWKLEESKCLENSTYAWGESQLLNQD